MHRLRFIEVLEMKSDVQQQEAMVLRLKEVRQFTGLSRSTLYELMRKDGPRYDPTFPRPFALGSRARGYLASELVAWLESKSTNRS